VVEDLTGVVRQATKKRMSGGVKVRAKEIKVSILQFANNTLVLCEEKIKKCSCCENHTQVF